MTVEGTQTQNRKPLRAVVRRIADESTRIWDPLACSNPAGSTTTVAAREGEPARLIAELKVSGTTVEQIETFSSDPLGGDGLLVCVGAEEVRVYLFRAMETLLPRPPRIDPDNPSNLGSAMVAWSGRPRFWHRGPILVLYLGEDPATEGILVSVLGTAFASGTESGRGPRGVSGPCNEG